MTTEQAKKLADEALACLAAALERGQSEALRTYLSAMGRFHRYSFGNVLLILWQKPNASHVAGYRTWQSFGRFVKPGEKGIAILAPLLVKRRREESEDYEPKESDEEKVLRFRVVHVFDVSQTEGEPLPEFAPMRGDSSAHLPRLKELVSSRGIVLDYVTTLHGARGVSRGGRIELLAGLPSAEEFAVLVHELAHELLHHAKWRRGISKSVRETEAEAVAFVVSQAIGLNATTHSSDYIQLYSGNKATLAASLDVIQRTATEIVVALQDAANHEAAHPIA